MCTIFGDNIQARSIRGQPHLPPHTFLAAYIFLKFTSKKLTYHGVATPPSAFGGVWIRKSTVKLKLQGIPPPLRMFTILRISQFSIIFVLFFITGQGVLEDWDCPPPTFKTMLSTLVDITPVPSIEGWKKICNHMIYCSPFHKTS